MPLDSIPYNPLQVNGMTDNFRCKMTINDHHKYAFALSDKEEVKCVRSSFSVSVSMILHLMF